MKYVGVQMKANVRAFDGDWLGFCCQGLMVIERLLEEYCHYQLPGRCSRFIGMVSWP